MRGRTGKRVCVLNSENGRSLWFGGLLGEVSSVTVGALEEEQNGW